jgi:hypothetical protein
MKRILFSDNGTISDFSTELNNYKSGSKTFNYTTAQDALYIASREPFNHIYFKLSSINAVSATMTVSYWSGEWTNAVEVIDETAGFTQSGFVTFTPDKDVAWERENSEDMDDIDSVTIYDRYWIKITFNQTLTNTTAIAWVGSLFSNDDDLDAEYPDLNRPNVKTSFKVGKTDWQEQHVKAADMIIKDLQDKGIITESGQILEREDFKNASVQKVAEIIFQSLGDDYIDQQISAKKEYNERLSKRIYRIDTNKNAIEEVAEQSNTSGWLSR